MWRDGYALVLADGLNVYRGFQPIAHDWVADPSNLPVTNLGAHALVELVGQEVFGYLIVRDWTAVV